MFIQNLVNYNGRYACLWRSGVKQNERKEKPFLSVEVGSYRFEVWGAAVCCTFLFARFAKVPLLFLGGQAWVVSSWSHSFSLMLSEVSHCYQLIPAEMPGSSKARKLPSQSWAVERLKGHNKPTEWQRSASKSRASSQKSVVNVARALDGSKLSSRSYSPHSNRSRSSSRLSEVRQRQSSEPKTPRWVEDFRKTMVDMQKANSKCLEHLEAELCKVKKKNEKEERKAAYKFTKKWNEEQYEFNQEIYHKMELAAEESDEGEHGHLLPEGTKRINEQNVQDFDGYRPL